MYCRVVLDVNAETPLGQVTATTDKLVDLSPVPASPHAPPSTSALAIHAALARIARASARGEWDRELPRTPPPSAPAVLGAKGGARGQLQLGDLFARHGYLTLTAAA